MSITIIDDVARASQQPPSRHPPRPSCSFKTARELSCDIDQCSSGYPTAIAGQTAAHNSIWAGLGLSTRFARMLCSMLCSNVALVSLSSLCFPLLLRLAPRTLCHLARTSDNHGDAIYDSHRPSNQTCSRLHQHWLHLQDRSSMRPPGL